MRDHILAAEVSALTRYYDQLIGYARLDHDRGLLFDLIECPRKETVAAFNEARFVLMHIAYPYDNELVALVKHFPVEQLRTLYRGEGLDLERYMEGVELTLIKRSLERTQGNKVQAARLLNLKRTTLVEKLKRFDKTV